MIQEQGKNGSIVMKICMVTPYFPPQPKACAIRMFSFVKEWCKKKDTDILVITPHSRDRIEERKFQATLMANVRVKRLFSLPAKKKTWMFRLYKEFIWSLGLGWELFFTKFDWLFVTSPLFFQTFVSVVVGKLRRKPCFIDIRDLFPDIVFEASPIKPKSLMGRILKRMEKYIYKNATMVFAATQGIANLVKTRTGTPVVLARNGIEIDLFKKPIPPGDPGKKRNFGIVFHGNIGELYDFDFLIRLGVALKNRHVDTYQIHIFGEGSQSTDLKKKIHGYGLNEIVSMNSSLDYKKIPDFIQRFDVGIAPLKKWKLNHTIFPVKVYEFMACGLPVIVTSGTEAGDFITRNKIGISIGTDDIDKTIEYLMFLKQNPGERDRIQKTEMKLIAEFDRGMIARRVFSEMVRAVDKNGA